MNRFEAASKVAANRTFFYGKWLEFCEWVEKCAEELYQYQHQPHGRAKRWKGLTCPSVQEWYKAVSKAHKREQRLPGNWVKWAGYDLEAGFRTTHLHLEPYSFFAPTEIVNPINWLLWQENPRAATPAEQLLVSCARLIMAHDSTMARWESIGIAGAYVGKFARDNCYEDIRKRLDTQEAKDALAAAWDDEVRPLLENNGRTDRATTPGNLPPKALYVFRRAGNTGYVTAFGGEETGNVPRVTGKLTGLDYINVLLRREAEHHRTPNRVPDRMTPAEVSRMAAGALQDQRPNEKPEDLVDSTAWKKAQKRRDELTRIIEDPTVDPADKADAQEDLDCLEKQLASDTRPGANGKPRSKTFSNDRTKTHGAIRMAIIRAIEAIRSVDPGLADHFEKHIDHEEGGHSYAPDSHIDWSLE